MICGVDEAGKGAVLGPLVVAAVECPDIDSCDGLGVRDSKLLSKRKREFLFDSIIERFPVKVITLSPEEIDNARAWESLNVILARSHARAISGLTVDVAYVDACDVNPVRYGQMVQASLIKPCTVISKHKAESSYPPVAAASIVAKVQRDKAIFELAREYGEIGSGYPSDAVTVSFLSRYINDHGKPPGCARKSWKTVGYLLNRLHQATLFDF